MKSNRLWVALMASGLAFAGAGLVGCEQETTPGDALDNALEDAGDAVENAGEEMEGAATQAEEAVEDAANNVEDAAQ